MNKALKYVVFALCCALVTAVVNAQVPIGPLLVRAYALFANDGVRIADTNASHYLHVRPGSNLTADRDLTLTTGDAARTLTLSGDATISGTNTGDQTTITGNAGTATALAANGANCSAGSFPLGVDASGASETCTALPTTIAGTANEISASASTGAITLSLPSAVDLTSKVLRVPNSTSLPVTCTVGDAYMDTDATSGARWYLCESTNTWAVQGGGGGGVTASSTDTFTNKTIDAEAIGNVITLSSISTFAAANCQGTTAFTAFATPAANAPAATCVTGTNTNYATLDFDAATDESVQYHFPLASDWTGNIDIAFRWRAAATSGDVVWAVQTICVADGETGDPAFNTASTVTDTAKGTTLQFNDASISAITITGCAAGEELMFKLYRDADAGGDTMTGDAQLIHARFTTRRAQ